MARHSKFNNRKVQYDGHMFDSVAEYEHYIKLRLMEQSGLISDLEVHKPFIIFDGFRNVAGQKRRTKSYEVDFVYRDNETGGKVYEDVKGVSTAMFRLKRDLFERRYGVALIEIKV